MWIERLDIRGFKRLQGTYDFSPHLTVINGGNEAGKSSMHDAIIRTLFGFSKSERRMRGGESVWTRCAPWNGDPFAVNAVVRLSDRSYAIEWDFASHRVRLRDIERGEDLSAQVLGARDEVALGQYLLKLGLDDFRHACCLDQAKITAVAHSESLVGALQQAVESGARDTGVEEATERLDEFLRAEIGVRVNTLQPNPTGRLRRLQTRAFELKELLGGANQDHSEITGLEQERHELADKRGVAVAELTRVDQEILGHEEAALAERLKRARQHRDRAAIDTSSDPLPDEELEADITAILVEFDRLEDEIVGFGPQVQTADGSVAKLEVRRATLQAKHDGLDGYSGVDTSVGEAVRDLASRRAELSQATPTEQPVLPERPPPFAVSQTRTLWVACGAAAVLSVVVGIAINPVALVGLLLAGFLLYRAAQRPRVAHPTAVFDPAARAARREEIEHELSRTLDSSRAADLPDLGQRADAYLAACRQHGHRIELAAELAEVKAELNAARSPIIEVERRRTRIQEIERQLASHSRDLGISTADAAIARGELERRAKLARRQCAKEVAAVEAEAGYRTALGGLSLEELESEHEVAAAKLVDHLGGRSPVESPALDRAGLAARRSELGVQIADLDMRITELRTQISDREGRLPDVPALREEADTIGARVQTLAESASAVALARDSLREAAREAHRAFRPHLERALKANLARLTNDRYGEVTIDDELQITVIAPETGRGVPADELSRGTQDQIFFVERLEMVDLLDPTTGEAPLLLDEPFVHFDGKRLELALELLGEEADERQVILFTTDPGLAERAAAVRSDASLISLEAPE